MRIKITEIEADARELRESNTLAQNFANLLSKCFQSTEPFEDEKVVAWMPLPEPYKEEEE